MSDLIQLRGQLLKDIQSVELKILKDVAAFCDNNNIRYCITSGTLLGAVRHGGFIPWDDDIDISMPRADFEKFLVLSKNLPKEYTCVATRFDNNYPIGIVKVKKNGTVMKEPSMAHLDINHGIWIDIFPLDRVKNIKMLAVRARILYLINTAISNKLKIVREPSKTTTKIACWLLNKFSVKTLDRWRTFFMTLEENTNGEFYTSFVSNLGFKNLLFNENVYFPLKKAKFEDEYFNIPNNADQWLTAAYGDYMTPPPIEKQINCHRIQEIEL